MSIEAAITFFIAVFIFGVTPGPGVFALLATALSTGVKRCWALSLGMTISDMLYLLMAIFGLSTIAENYAGLFTVIRFVGAGYLIYLGWLMWTSPVDVNFSEKQAEAEASGSAFNWGRGFVQGFLISFSNPKVILFYIAFLPTFMDLSVLTHADTVLVSVLTFFALMLGLMLISFSASKARQQLTSKKSVQRLNRTAGAIMAAAGLFLIFQGS